MRQEVAKPSSSRRFCRYRFYTCHVLPAFDTPLFTPPSQSEHLRRRQAKGIRTSHWRSRFEDGKDQHEGRARVIAESDRGLAR